MRTAMNLKKITAYLDEYLHVSDFHDDAANGLQVENSGRVKRAAVAVDACLETIKKAAAARCDVLIVHHGLFWGRPFILTGNYYQRISALIKADIALYAVHLPLDAHLKVGNNAQIAHKLGLKNIEPFAQYHGQPIGMKGWLATAQVRTAVAKKLEAILGTCTAFLQFGPEKISSVGVVSGSASEPYLINELHDLKIDLLVTGEPKHGAYYLIQELGLNVFYGGHYSTERFGPQALGDHIRKKLGISTVFLDAPSPF
jgi:dinuclear metal center YbgI/SA1388 family protein